MIVLHEVSKTVGHGSSEREVLRDLQWRIGPRSRHVILAKKGAGKTTLLDLISGWTAPTEGWVERQGVVASTRNLVRGDPRATVRQLIRGLCILYTADPAEVERFVCKFTMMDDLPSRSLHSVVGTFRRVLHSALFYALPCDFYLFDDTINRLPPNIMPMAERAFQLREAQAGMILATSAPSVARGFGGRLTILHGGRLFPFDDLKEGIAVFRQLPETAAPGGERTPEPEEAEDDSGLDVMI